MLYKHKEAISLRDEIVLLKGMLGEFSGLTEVTIYPKVC